jgi:hypothetical protein
MFGHKKRTMQNENALKASITNSPDWETAVTDFIRCTTQLGQPFTSGHVTTILRVYRPELRFKHADIGERCRDAFYQGEVDYSTNGAVQEPRVCAGLGRTPAGTTVLVYAPDQDAALEFLFELDIPEPGAGLTQMPQEHPIQAGVQIKPALPSPADMKATVLSDHRLCVPRAALEALLHVTGRSFRADQRVWVRFAGTPDYDKALITLDQQPGAVDYGVQATRGRILFPKAGTGQFGHGDIFAVEVKGDELVCDISTPL